MSNDIIIVGAKRTPIGGLLGELSALTASELGAVAIRAAIAQANIDPASIDEVFMGNVLSAGQGQAPARQAALGAGCPVSVGATTINKMCGSGLKAIMLAHDLLKAGTGNMFAAGGMESMSQAPYLLKKARAGYRLGHDKVWDHMFLDGLEDAYDKGKLMGVFAEYCADEYHFDRETQDDYAINSLERAQEAIRSGAFMPEITPITITTKHGEEVISQDELPLKAKLDKIRQLKPAFKADGTVTPANSSSISDGAAAVILTTADYANAQGLKPLARIVGHTTFAHEPAWFSTAPVSAIQQLLTNIQWDVSDVDLYEINEAFAVVTMAAMKELDIPRDKVNIFGGACALGHPIGASGARILVTLMNALQQRRLTRGVASLCIGGGEAVAMAIELI